MGTLKDGKTRGFQLLVFSFPYKGRAIPFWFVVFSSRTISQEDTSRNLVHLKAFLQVKDLLGKRPLVMDREFSYGRLLSQLKEARIHFVVRLNTKATIPSRYSRLLFISFSRPKRLLRSRKLSSIAILFR